MLREIRFVAGLLVAAALPCAAQDEILFSAEQWGKPNLRMEQSTDRVIESVLSTNANFEPMSRYAEGTRLRRLGRPVGRLDIRVSSGMFLTCTASLIATDLILTNHHCVPGTRTDRRITEASLLMGYYSMSDTSGAKRYSVRIQPVDSDPSLDYAVLRVQGDPGAEWGVVTLAAITPRVGDAFLLIHHPGGRPMHVTRGGCVSASPKAVENDDLYHKCDSLPGSSGAPIFSDDRAVVLALHYAGSVGTGPELSNYGKLIGFIQSKSTAIRTLLAANSRPAHDVAKPVPASRETASDVALGKAEAGTAPGAVPPEFRLFGETIKILFTATRKPDMEALERHLRQRYARVSTQQVWSVPEQFRNRIVSASEKLGVANAIAQSSRRIAGLGVLESVEQKGDELTIWLGPP